MKPICLTLAELPAAVSVKLAFGQTVEIAEEVILTVGSGLTDIFTVCVSEQTPPPEAVHR